MLVRSAASQLESPRSGAVDLFSITQAQPSWSIGRSKVTASVVRAGSTSVAPIGGSKAMTLGAAPVAPADGSVCTESFGVDASRLQEASKRSATSAERGTVR